MKQPTYTDSGDDRKLTEATRLKLSREWADPYIPRKRHNRRNERIEDPRVAATVAALMLGILLALGTFAFILFLLTN